VKSRLWKPPGNPAAPALALLQELAPLPALVPFGAVMARAPQPVMGVAETGAAAGNGLYAALDLGTNNCRLLIARPGPGGFRIADSFSRIVRLGEGLGHGNRLSEPAMARTIEALKACAQRLDEKGVVRRRLIATEACRAAENGPEFLGRVQEQTGLRLEIVDRQTEAELAAAGCAVLMARNADSVILFDIGGGSTEVVWLGAEAGAKPIRSRIRSWTSLPVGVVTLAERHGGIAVDSGLYRRMVEEVNGLLGGFRAQVDMRRLGRNFHLLGTSGTVTTIAAMHLQLPRYDRRQVDGLWMTTPEAQVVIAGLLGMDYAARAANPCIGHERADLVLAGCAIYDALAECFPAERIRIADRGLREGILMQLMMEDGVWMRSHEARP
jgi:exopolyphosphatase / guanosine-5'-triphosphate,3'-diphosphate pyrophosphatase